MRIIVEEGDGTQRAPLILVDLDDGKGLVPLQQVFQRIFAALDELRALPHVPHAQAQGPR